MKNTLVLFTKSFPYTNDESFLQPELDILASGFKNIFIVALIQNNKQLPTDSRYQVIALPHQTISNWKILFSYFFFCLPVELSKNFNYKGIVGKLRYHYNVFKNAYLRALSLEKVLEQKGISPENTVFYSYWLNENALSLVILKKRISSLYIVGRGHGYDVFPEQAMYGYNPFQATIIQGLDKIVSVSAAGALFLKQKYPAAASKIEVSYLGTMASNEISPVDGTVVRVVSCAHVRALKAIHRIPKILSLLDQPCEWIHIGGFRDEMYKQQVEQAIQQAKATNPGLNVVIQGEMNREEIDNFYKTTPITCFISMSTTEGLPVSMMEAISYGVPLFSTNVGGCNEICTDKTGVYVDKSLSDEQVAAMLNEFIMYIAQGKYPRLQVRKFWEENFNGAYNYQQLLENNLQ